MSEITIQGISKTFGDTRVLNDISFCAKDGNLLSLLGPSGCGKTTLLRIIAGLEYADSGTIHVGERDLTPIPVEKRNIGVVFQNYALIPHMTVFNNIAYGLKIRKVPKGGAVHPSCRTYRYDRPQGDTALRRPAAARSAGSSSDHRAGHPAAR